jgi:hypothetical protein
MHHTVGHLARATGLTVRTLHHWDEIGLLRPAERSGAGHRRYSAEDVERLYRIVALRASARPAPTPPTRACGRWPRSGGSSSRRSRAATRASTPR